MRLHSELKTWLHDSQCCECYSSGSLWQAIKRGLRRRRKQVRKSGTHDYTQVVDMSSLITTLDPDAASFATMLSKFPKSHVAQSVDWLEDEMFPVLGFRAVSWLNSDEMWDWEGWDTEREKWERERDEALLHFSKTTITVSSGTGHHFRVGDLVRDVKTGETLTVAAS